MMARLGGGLGGFRCHPVIQVCSSIRRRALPRNPRELRYSTASSELLPEHPDAWTEWRLAPREPEKHQTDPMGVTVPLPVP